MSSEQKKGCDGKLISPHLEAYGYETYPEYFFNLPHKGGTRVSCKETEPSKIVNWFIEIGKEFHASPVILLILGKKAKGLIAEKTITNPEKFKEYLDAAKNHIQDKINEINIHFSEHGKKFLDKKRGPDKKVLPKLDKELKKIIKELGPNAKPKDVISRIEKLCEAKFPEANPSFEIHSFWQEVVREDSQQEDGTLIKAGVSFVADPIRMQEHKRSFGTISNRIRYLKKEILNKIE